MLMSISTCIVITQMLVISKGAPKLGSIFYEPLLDGSYTNGKYNLNIQRFKPYYPKPPIIKRRDSNIVEGNTETPCHGYEYDGMKCKIINNRILCGYNKNNGRVKNSAEITDMGNGCRMRKDRIECGYLVVPQNKQKLVNIKPTRTLSRNAIIKKLIVTTQSTQQTKTESTEHTTVTTSTTLAEDTTKLDTTTTTSDIPKGSKSAIVEDQTEVSVTEESVPYWGIHQEAAQELHRDLLVNGKDKPSVQLRKRIKLIALTTGKSTETTSTTTDAPSSSIADRTLFQKETGNNVENSTTKFTQNKVDFSSNSTETNITEGESTDKPPPLCIDKQDRIVCYDTAKFILFKKPIKD